MYRSYLKNGGGFFKKSRVNFMTTKEIVKGLEFRAETLMKAFNALTKNDGIPDSILNDYESRIDEIESLIMWIEGKK